MFIWSSINPLFISLIRACVANEIIKMGQLCTPGGGGAVLGIVGGGVMFRFLKYAILRTFIRSRGCLENPTRFQTIMVKIIWAF